MHYYATEFPGNVVGLIDSQKGLANEYRYTPWGEVQSVQETVPNSLRFQAREWDEGTGMYYFRNRWYDPQLQRFNSEDPIGLEGGINLYAFTENNPVNFTDPLGLCTLEKTVVDTNGDGTPDREVYACKGGGAVSLGGIFSSGLGRAISWGSFLSGFGSRTSSSAPGLIALRGGSGRGPASGSTSAQPKSPAVQQQCSSGAFKNAAYNGAANGALWGGPYGAVVGGVYGYTGGKVVGGAVGAITSAPGGVTAVVGWLAGDYLGGAIGGALGGTVGYVYGSVAGAGLGAVGGAFSQALTCGRANMGWPTP